MKKDDDTLKDNAIRWLRGEFNAKSDARRVLGVREIIGDAAVYDQLKLIARFCRLADYKGLLVCLDELVNLYKLANTEARNGNYEQILRILNDLEQGSAAGLGVVLGGTPEFLLDPRRGLFSYPALQSRLADNPFARGDLVDLTGPVLRLGVLGREHFVALQGKLGTVYNSGKPDSVQLPTEVFPAFMRHCEQRIGEATFRTPRTTITAFIGLLAVLEQNPGAEWQTLLQQTKIALDSVGEDAGLDDELVSLVL